MSYSSRFHGLAIAVIAIMLASFLACPTCNCVAGELLVASFDNRKILRYDANTGEYLGAFAEHDALDSPHGMVFGPDGDLYVANFGADNILRLDGKSGAYKGVFTSGVQPGYPTDLSFGPDGDLYVSANNSSAVMRYDGTTGRYIEKYPVGIPMAVQFDRNGTLFAGNSNGVYRRSAESGLFTQFTSPRLDYPNDFDFGPDGDIYMPIIAQRQTQYGNTVVRFDGSTGELIGIHASGPEMDRPSSVELGPSGELFVACWWDRRVLRYHPDGTFDKVVAFGDPLTRPGGLLYVPEPSTFILLTAGAFGLLAYGWRRRHSC